MTLKKIETDHAPAAIGPYSQGIVSGPFAFVSGQLGLNPETGDLVGPAIEDQAMQALSNLLKIVEAAGGSLEKIVAVDVYVTDMSNFAKLNRIYEYFFKGHNPARAVVEVGALPKGACVEIKCIAFIPQEVNV